MHRVDSARLFRDAAIRKRRAEGILTGTVAGFAAVTGGLAVSGATDGYAVFLILLGVWLVAQRRYARADRSVALWTARVIREQDKFDSKLERKMEW